MQSQIQPAGYQVLACSSNNRQLLVEADPRRHLQRYYRSCDGEARYKSFTRLWDIYEDRRRDNWRVSSGRRSGTRGGDGSDSMALLNGMPCQSWEWEAGLCLDVVR